MKVFKVADIKKLQSQVTRGEISYSRLVEILNAMVQDQIELSTEQISEIMENFSYSWHEDYYNREDFLLDLEHEIKQTLKA